MKILTKADQELIINALAAVTKSGGGSPTYALQRALSMSWEIDPVDSCVLTLQRIAAGELAEDDDYPNRGSLVQLRRPDGKWTVISTLTGRIIKTSSQKYTGIPELAEATKALKDIEEGQELILAGLKSTQETLQKILDILPQASGARDQ